MSTVVTCVDGSTTSLSDDELDLLAGQIRGPVAAGYGASQASTHPLWNPLHADRPAVVVGCTGTPDVVEAVRFARERDLRVIVRGGGHSVAGLSTAEDGFVIDLGRMRAVQVDPDRRVVRVQGGALLGDVDRETQVHGLATPLGRVSGTGVAGLTLGGGYGNLGSAFGLSCDNLLEIEIVGADGTPRVISAERDPELFWALRGGGGGSARRRGSPSGCIPSARSWRSLRCCTRSMSCRRCCGAGGTWSSRCRRPCPRAW